MVRLGLARTKRLPMRLHKPSERIPKTNASSLLPRRPHLPSCDAIRNTSNGRTIRDATNSELRINMGPKYSSLAHRIYSQSRLRSHHWPPKTRRKIRVRRQQGQAARYGSRPRTGNINLFYNNKQLIILIIIQNMPLDCVEPIGTSSVTRSVAHVAELSLASALAQDTREALREA